MCRNITLIGSVLLYFGITLLINLGNTELCEECITPDPENHKGWCVPAKYCPHIGNILSKLSILPSDYQKFIRNSQCSSDGAENYCCGIGLVEQKFFDESKQICNISIGGRIIETSTEPPIFQPPIVLRESNYEPSTFDLDAHPNLKLLTDENCGLSDDGDKIAFGEISNIDEFPFMALLQYDRNKKDEFNCGGTLINKNYVLTAAHCYKPELFSVRLGEHDVSKEKDCQTSHRTQICNDPVQDIPIAEIHIHNNFVSRTLLNDIALIRLKTPANTTVNNVRFVCLPITAKLRERKITKANVVGWGRTEKGDEKSDILLKGGVDVNQERQKCVDTYKNEYNININEKYLCAIGAQGKTDTCRGDSGGPLLHRPQIDGEANERLVQYGIISAGPAGCGEKVNTIGGAIYTNIPRFMRWILDKIRE